LLMGAPSLDVRRKEEVKKKRRIGKRLKLFELPEEPTHKKGISAQG